MGFSPEAIYGKKRKGEKITALTAYDYPFAKILDEAGIDIVLVGDSLGMVLLGYENTLKVTMTEMLHHTKAVARAVKKSLVVADMPFHSYENSAMTVSNARLFLKAGADAVKLEGGKRVEAQVRALRKARIPIMGHVGMTPQSVKELGGYRVQGKKSEDAEKIIQDAELLDRLGVFSMVLECIPAGLAQTITKRVRCPTIGIGAGPRTDGQVLVLHDMLGFKSAVAPKFVRRYADLEKEARQAVAAYRKDVLRGRFPSAKESY